MSAELRVVKRWYRCVLVDDGSLWCESSDEDEVLMMGELADRPVRYDAMEVMQFDGPWQEMRPSINSLALAKAAAAERRREMAEDAS